MILYPDIKPKRRQTRLHSLNYGYFEKIDSPSKAYILGYLFADGYVESSGRGFTIRLHKQDIETLELIKQELEYTGNITHIPAKNQVQLTICSQYVIEGLSKWGFIRNKTKVLTFPSIKEHIPHFIRGYFDGDGSISDRAIVIVCASKDFINSMLNFIVPVIRRTPIVRLHRNAYRIEMHRRDKSFLDWMYSEPQPSLSRKLQKYLDYWKYTGE